MITSLAIMSYMGRFSSAKQAAWSLVRCHQHGGKIKEFYQRLYPKKGAKKSIIAVSRKMIEVCIL
ncbi:hypothetical protein LEP1GSC024_2167 [Leptospira noguchii str. 2001034031]|uniref:Transposase, IS116/IS110/IS902 domain protein n=1 Tax=Leptospira noguchii str. 2001034031 TaxID=1193053 RepID=M6Y775_9LEPT|nr:hypothetical protein LEP1GSC024_2167 [Leptospira noguchii str. 2001034031]